MSTLHFQQLGDAAAEPLLLLHSGAMTAAEWEPQQDLLAKNFRLILPDLPGHGRSLLNANAKRLAIADMGQALLALMDELTISQTHVVGSSMGGAIALWLTVNYPQRIKKLVLFRIGYGKDQQTYQGTRSMADPDYWRSVGLERWLSRQHEPQGGPDAWQRVIGRVMEAMQPEKTDHNYSLEALRSIAHPTLIIAGDRDPLVPIEHALEMHQAIPDSGLWLLPYTTHITATNTWRSESFAIEVSRFLQGRGVAR